MRRPFVVAATLAASAAAVVVAVPSSARLAPAQRLAEVTTITATHSGTAEVVLYDDATISPKSTGNPDVSLTGAGRLVGFQLTREDGVDDGLYAARVPGFLGGKVEVGGSAVPRGTCTPGTLPVVTSGSCTSPTPTAIKLHQGYYQLAVLTDGNPLHITIRLHGAPSGHARVSLRHTFQSIEAPMPARESIGSTTITYGVTAPKPGALRVGTLVAAKLHASATTRAASFCERRDDGAPPPYAFSPPCPNGQIEGYAWRLHPPANPVVYDTGGGSVFVYGNDSTSAPTGVGGSFVDSDGPTYVGGLSVWLWTSDPMPFFGGIGWNT